jgi:hypothetical protein
MRDDRHAVSAFDHGIGFLEGRLDVANGTLIRLADVAAAEGRFRWIFEGVLFLDEVLKGSIFACSMPGRLMSKLYLARPVALSGPSRRWILVPMSRRSFGQVFAMV